MPQVHIKESEPFDVALRRFKRSCEKAGILAKLRQIEFYEKPTARRKRKHAAAIKRWEKKLFKERESMFPVRGKVRKNDRRSRFGQSKRSNLSGDGDRRGSDDSKA